MAGREVTADPSPSPFWRRFLRLQYALVRRFDPLARQLYLCGLLGITGELTVAGRRTGRLQSVLLGILIVDGRGYVGHPNGPVDWSRNLAASGRGWLALPGAAAREVRAVPLPPGPERTAAIVATARQQPFPGNVVYRLARRHILAVGDYFRLDEPD
ncbi:MAG TPA: hypothetical protein VFW86_06410 [Candidatus Limnocylindrales bacterium]|nr:hypothetical protein [Candidatus Limnocylindrales bacterium]